MLYYMNISIDKCANSMEFFFVCLLNIHTQTYDSTLRKEKPVKLLEYNSIEWKIKIIIELFFSISKERRKRKSRYEILIKLKRSNLTSD